MEIKKRISIINSMPGYNHTKYYGTCLPDVTVKEIEEMIFHPCFGGRDVKINGNQWTGIRHED